MARYRPSLVAALIASAATALALSAADSPRPASPVGDIAPGTAAAPAAPAPAPAAASVGWLDRYGSYNVRQGTWMLVPSPNGC